MEIIIDKALDDYDKQQQPKEKNRARVARTEARTPTKALTDLALYAK